MNNHADDVADSPPSSGIPGARVHRYEQSEILCNHCRVDNVTDGVAGEDRSTCSSCGASIWHSSAYFGRESSSAPEDVQLQPASGPMANLHSRHTLQPPMPDAQQFAPYALIGVHAPVGVAELTTIRPLPQVLNCGSPSLKAMFIPHDQSLTLAINTSYLEGPEHGPPLNFTEEMKLRSEEDKFPYREDGRGLRGWSNSGTRGTRGNRYEPYSCQHHRRSVNVTTDGTDRLAHAGTITRSLRTSVWQSSSDSGPCAWNTGGSQGSQADAQLQEVPTSMPSLHSPCTMLYGLPAVQYPVPQ